MQSSQINIKKHLFRRIILINKCTFVNKVTIERKKKHKAGCFEKQNNKVTVLLIEIVSIHLQMIFYKEVRIILFEF